MCLRFVHFSRGYLDKGSLVDDHRAIARRYIKSWFLPDLVVTAIDLVSWLTVKLVTLPKINILNPKSWRFGRWFSFSFRGDLLGENGRLVDNMSISFGVLLGYISLESCVYKKSIYYKMTVGHLKNMVIPALAWRKLIICFHVFSTYHFML